MRALALASALLSLALVGCPGDEKDGTDTVDTAETGDGVDADGDGYNSAEDCDDSDASINPGADEECDGLDNNCDGNVDEDVTTTYYGDVDGDGFGDEGATLESCSASAGWVAVGGDCDDSDPYVNPAAEEMCDGEDNDCDGTVDNDLDSSTWYQDSDADGYGNPDEMLDACAAPSGYVDNASDCDDTSAMEPVHADASSGSSSGTGSAANPLDSLQDAIDLANVCVFAAPGMFYENIDFDGKNIAVYGVDGAEDTFIIGDGTDSTVTFQSGETGDAILTGFTITGGIGKMEEVVETESDGSSSTVTTTTWTYYGGGVYINNASPTLYDLIIADNDMPAYSYSNPSEGVYEYVYSWGGGMFVADSDISPWNIVIQDNSADGGGGLYVASSASVDMLWGQILSNSASGGGGAMSGGSLSLNNSILNANTAYDSGSSIYGAAINAIAGSVWQNFVTSVDNQGSSSNYVSNGATLGLWNSILAGNNDGYVVDGDVGGSLSASYSDVYESSGANFGATITDPTGSNGNISDDPMFVTFSENGDPSDDNLMLASGSPAADAGDPAESDWDGSAADMGAYGGTDGGW